MPSRSRRSRADRAAAATSSAQCVVANSTSWPTSAATEAATLAGSVRASSEVSTGVRAMAMDSAASVSIDPAPIADANESSAGADTNCPIRDRRSAWRPETRVTEAISEDGVRKPCRAASPACPSARSDRSAISAAVALRRLSTSRPTCSTEAVSASSSASPVDDPTRTPASSVAASRRVSVWVAIRTF